MADGQQDGAPGAPEADAALLAVLDAFDTEGLTAQGANLGEVGMRHRCGGGIPGFIEHRWWCGLPDGESSLVPLGDLVRLALSHLAQCPGRAPAALPEARAAGQGAGG